MRHLGSAYTFPHVHGLFAEKVVVHQSQCRVVSNMQPEVAAFAEPLGVHSLGDIMGKNFAVMGAGPIGILCAAAAKILGADRVTVFDIRDNPLSIVKELGADEEVNTMTNPETIKEFSAHKGQFDCALEATGNGFAAMQTMAMGRPEGTIAQVGMFGTGH